MTDNELLALIKSTIDAGLAAHGIPLVVVTQNFQREQAGARSGPGVYVHKVADRRYGSPARIYTPDSGSAMDSRFIQQFETTFQIAALVKQAANNPAQLTASDVLNRVADIMQSDEGIASFKTENVQILRIMDVSNTYAKDDYDQFEAEPSLDFILTYAREHIATTPAVSIFESGVYRI
jgi:hypothetical protein